MLRHSGARALEAAKTIPLTRSLSQKSRAWFREVPKAPVSATHDVLNQSSRLPDWSAYEDDQALVDGVRMHGASAFEKHLIKYGHYAGSEATRRRHREANDNPPVLQQFDKVRWAHRFGGRFASAPLCLAALFSSATVWTRFPFTPHTTPSWRRLWGDRCPVLPGRAKVTLERTSHVPC